MLMQEITLKDKEKVETYLHGMPTQLCNYSFSHLFLYREKYKFRFSEAPYPYILSLGKKSYVMPLSFTEEAVEFYQTLKLPLFPIDQAHRSLFPETQLQEMQGEDDYLYFREKLAAYPGRKLAGRRNLSKQFLHHYTHEFKLAEESDFPLVEDRLLCWSKINHDTADLKECQEALQLHKELGLSTYLLQSQGVVIAFVVGAYLNKTTFDFHFAKADHEYKGVYQYLYQKVAQALPEEITWINLENDLDIEGIRRAKRNYFPDAMGKKYRLNVQQREDEC